MYNRTPFTWHYFSLIVLAFFVSSRKKNTSIRSSPCEQTTETKRQRETTNTSNTKITEFMLVSANNNNHNPSIARINCKCVLDANSYERDRNRQPSYIRTNDMKEEKKKQLSWVIKQVVL